MRYNFIRLNISDLDDFQTASNQLNSISKVLENQRHKYNDKMNEEIKHRLNNYIVNCKEILFDFYMIYSETDLRSKNLSKEVCLNINEIYTSYNQFLK